MNVSLSVEKKAHSLCLDIARAHRSSITGWVHFHQDKEESSKEVIPIFENLCYALSLFREKQSECIEEAKELLLKIFPFQLKEGYFPQFLHTYPHPASYKTLISFLFILFWVYTDFHHVTEKSFQWALKKSIERLLSYLKAQEEKLSYLTRLQLQCIESLWEKNPLPEVLFRGSLDEEAELCNFFLQVAPEKALPFLERLEASYHPLFLKLSARCLQKKNHYSPSFFDLFFAHRTQEYPSCLLEPSSLHFLAALLAPVEPKEFYMDKEPHCIRGSFVQEEKDHHFRYLWQEKKGFSSLFCQDKLVACFLESPTIFTFAYPQEYLLDRQGSYELNFYTEYSPEKEIPIEGKKATAFTLGEKLLVITPLHRFSLCLELLEGEGTFFGHVMRGNRPSQVDKDIFQAYDYRICVRTITRTPHLRLRAVLKPEALI